MHPEKTSFLLLIQVLLEPPITNIIKLFFAFVKWVIPHEILSYEEDRIETVLFLWVFVVSSYDKSLHFFRKLFKRPEKCWENPFQKENVAWNSVFSSFY